MTKPEALVELLELQGSAELITKSELTEEVRRRGGKISDRNITYYASAELVPAGLRLGRRGVVYPRLAATQLLFVIRCREAGLSIESIREVLPLWRVLQRGIRDQRMELSELEYVARQTITKTEANYAVPLVVNLALHDVCPSCRSSLSWVLKDGTIHDGAATEDLTITFLLAALDDNRCAQPVAWTQLQLPGIADPAGDEPATIILGIPNGVPLNRAVPVDAPRRNDSTPGIERELISH